MRGFIIESPCCAKYPPVKIVDEPEYNSDRGGGQTKRRTCEG
jgi:hypothetical protein